VDLPDATEGDAKVQLMPLGDVRRQIPRVWEVDWALPVAEDGTPWEVYAWLLDAADALGSSEVTILASTYDSLGSLARAIGDSEAQWLRAQPHQYRVGRITVHGVSRRGFWMTRGPVLVAWAHDDVLSEVEGKRPPAIAAVAMWPDDIATWRSVYRPDRIGQVRAEQEADFDTVVAPEIDGRVADALATAISVVNENHAVLSTHEREYVAGALVSLRERNVGVDVEAVRAYLMEAGWSGELINQVLELAERVARGQTPRHRRF
jgi:hypothetical protein